MTSTPPAWLFLDEATAALDPAAEQAAYDILRTRLPHAALVSIAHRPEVVRHHEGRWRVVSGASGGTLDPEAAP